MFLSATAETATNCGISTEVVMLILGAALGLIASLLTMVIQRWFDRRGKLNIFYRFSHQKNGSGTSWGFEDTEDGHKYFTVPVVYEIQNTSNTTRVIRDVSLLLFNGKTYSPTKSTQAMPYSVRPSNPMCCRSTGRKTQGRHLCTMQKAPTPRSSIKRCSKW